MDNPDFKDLCMGCMNHKGLETICHICGFAEGTQPDSPLHLPPGEILNGQYMLGRVLGHGGFGITYLAVDLNLDIRVAIKEYMPEGLAVRTIGYRTLSAYSSEKKEQFEYGAEKFLDEARILAKFCGESGIINIRNFFMENGTAYYVMDYLEGMSLKQYIQSQGNKLPFKEAVKLMLPVMEALEYVHEKGLLHRDVSPDNIYITKNGRVKLLDFGAARYAMSENSRSLSVILKPGFAPEEQYRSRGKQGPWTDVYACAATLYKAITGSNPPEAIERLVEDDIMLPSSLGADIPVYAETALMKALAVSAQNRYQDIKNFKEAVLFGPEEKAGPGINIPDASQNKREAGIAKLSADNVPNFVFTKEKQGQIINAADESIHNHNVHKNADQVRADDTALKRVWIYYRNRSDSDKLYRRLINGTNMQKVSDEERIDSLSYENGLFYYCKDKDLYRMSSDGRNIIKIRSSVMHVNVLNDWIYYSDAKDKYRLYKMHNFGFDKHRLGGISSLNFIVSGGWIYYINNSNGDKLCMITTSGTDNRLLADDKTEGISVNGGWIYYINGSDDSKIYKITTSGTDRQKVNDCKAWSIFSHGEWIYYNAYLHLNKMMTDGTGIQDAFNEDVKPLLALADPAVDR